MISNLLKGIIDMGLFTKTISSHDAVVKCIDLLSSNKYSYNMFSKIDKPDSVDITMIMESLKLVSMYIVLKTNYVNGDHIATNVISKVDNEHLMPFDYDLFEYSKEGLTDVLYTGTMKKKPGDFLNVSGELAGIAFGKYWLNSPINLDRIIILTDFILSAVVVYLNGFKKIESINY